MKNEKFNYLIKKIGDLPKDFIVDNRDDPDTCRCKELYDDVIEAFFGNIEMNQRHNIYKVENVEQQFGNKPTFYTVFVNDKQFLLSTDYMGPSIYWARERGVSDDEIIEYLSICRTLGGHILWPRGKDIKYKINTCKAGNNGVYDRIDWTLALIKIHYESISKEEFIYKANQLLPRQFQNKKTLDSKFSNMYNALECSKEWFKLFGTFEEFCIQFKLIGDKNFVSKKLEVQKMAEWFPFLPSDYREYIRNVCTAVEERNAIIFK